MLFIFKYLCKRVHVCVLSESTATGYNVKYIKTTKVHLGFNQLPSSVASKEKTMYGIFINS